MRHFGPVLHLLGPEADGADVANMTNKAGDFEIFGESSWRIFGRRWSLANCTCRRRTSLTPRSAEVGGFEIILGKLHESEAISA